jgi:xylan 1,4-beta-xylosidase
MIKSIFPIAFLLILVFPKLTAQNQSNIASNNVPRFISIDLNKEKGQFNTMFKECIGAGRANEGLRADWQQQLAMIKQECDFKYIRMHGLLTDDMGVYREDKNGNPEYNYQYIDVLYDYILSLGMKPFVELGFMPSALASGKQTIFWWKGNVTPPKDYNKWGDLIKNLVSHFTQRYGENEVKTWYFEVWNEPNLQNGFWTGTQDDYFKLYLYSATVIKNVNKDFKVGGPATAGAAWVPEMLEFCRKNNIPIDFISTHTYGVKQGFLDEFGSTGTLLDKNKWSVSGDIINSRKQIQNSSFPNLELHYTEWSSSYTPSDPIHDSYHEAAYILEKIKQTGNAATSMSYWVFTDIFEEAGPRFTPFHGGFGLLNYQGIKKPAYYSYYLLNKLGSTELENTDSSSWACKSTNGNFQLLLWNFSYTHPGDSINNQSYYIRDLPSIPRETITVDFSGIPSGKYSLEIYKVGYKNNDPYSTYLAMGRPQQLSKDQINLIKQQNNGAPAVRDIINVGSDGKFSKVIIANDNDVIMLNFIKQYYQ